MQRIAECFVSDTKPAEYHLQFHKKWFRWKHMPEKA